MPLFGRKKEQPAPPVAVEPELTPPPRPSSGDLACDYPECNRHDGINCAYGDRRQNRCQTQWCPDHYHLVGGVPYCRRHVAVAYALMVHEDGPAAAPDIQNRAPSLCAWVAAAIDAEVQRLLADVAGDRPGLTVHADPLALLIEGTPRTRYWERSWKLSDNLGTIAKLALKVAEPNDREVMTMVGREIVGAVIPPWVEHPQTDPTTREEFHNLVVQKLAQGLQEYLRLNAGVFAGRIGST